jgi:hypothetical protein
MNPNPPNPRPVLAWKNTREIPREIQPAPPDPQNEPEPDAPAPDAPRYNIYFFAPDPPAYFVRLVRYGFWFGVGLFVLFGFSLMLDHC